MRMSPLYSICICLLAALCGCTGNSDGKRQFISMGTAPIGGAFQVVGSALSEVLNEKKGANNWKLQANGTKGSQENIRRLERNE